MSESSDTRRPVVAIVSFHDRAGRVVGREGEAVFLGFSQTDGDWKDIDGGPGGSGLLETMRTRLGEDVRICRARVDWLDFNGAVWSRSYGREDVGSHGGIPGIASVEGRGSEGGEVR